MAKPTRLCPVEGCERKHFGKGYCKIHYLRMYRTGSTDSAHNWNPGGTCAVEGCERPAHARGYCGAHYARVKRLGEPGAADIKAFAKRSKYAGQPCSVEGCQRQARASGWCSMHYHRFARSGDPEGKWGADPRPPAQPFINADGYRMFTDGRLEHRVVMEEILGRPLWPQENVHHRNGDRADNRPENLELWVTRQPQGQRVEDLVAFVVSHYPALVRELLA